jgi:hypothetical protein
MMKGDKEIDKEKWYVTNNEADMWYSGTWKVTTRVIAPSHLPIAKSIYKNARSFDKGLG